MNKIICFELNILKDKGKLVVSIIYEIEMWAESLSPWILFCFSPFKAYTQVISNHKINNQMPRNNNQNVKCERLE